MSRTTAAIVVKERKEDQQYGRHPTYCMFVAAVPVIPMLLTIQLQKPSVQRPRAVPIRPDGILAG